MDQITVKEAKKFWAYVKCVKFEKKNGKTLAGSGFRLYFLAAAVLPRFFGLMFVETSSSGFLLFFGCSFLPVGADCLETFRRFGEVANVDLVVALTSGSEGKSDGVTAFVLSDLRMLGCNGFSVSGVSSSSSRSTVS